MALLEAFGLEKRFGGFHAVQGCSFAVEEGSITGLIGPNGAGKTTMFNLIAGFHQPDAGVIRFDGERIDGLAAHEIVRRGIVRTFQTPRELKAMTVEENLSVVPSGQSGEGLMRSLLLPWTTNHDEERVRAKAAEVLDYVGLTHVRDIPAGNLSGGQKKLLEFGRTLMAEPRLVLLDEPGAGVNPTLMRSLVAGIERAREERGITFLIIEHDMGLIMRLCDPIVVMAQGSKLHEGSPEEVQSAPEVIEAYLGAQP